MWISSGDPQFVWKPLSIPSYLWRCLSISIYLDIIIYFSIGFSVFSLSHSPKIRPVVYYFPHLNIIWLYLRQIHSLISQSFYTVWYSSFRRLFYLIKLSSVLLWFLFVPAAIIALISAPFSSFLLLQMCTTFRSFKLVLVRNLLIK